MNLEDQNFLTFLLKEYPYLHDLEMAVRKIQNSTGHGEISMSFRVTANKVDEGSMVVIEKKLYRQRDQNMI